MAEEGLVWVRPSAWFLLLPWLAALWFWWRHQHSANFWRRWVDADLLAHVTHESARQHHRHLLLVLALIGCIAAGALAGPSWRSQPVPVFRDLSARVVVLDLSPSMQSIDTAPNRLTVAKSAVAQLLREAAGMQLGLVVFGGDAFTVAPLTRDAATLLHLLLSVDATTLPREGARVDLGLAEAARLLEAADIARGDVHLVGDSPGDARASRAAERLAEMGFALSVIAVGTETGGPIRQADGRLVMDSGEVVVAKVPLPELANLARAGGGKFTRIDAPGSFNSLAEGGRRALTGKAVSRRQQRVDEGYWLVLLVLALGLLLSRRGWLLCVLGVSLLTPVQEVEAEANGDWWRRPDQRAAAIYADPREVVDPRFEQRLAEWPRWRAIVLFRAGQYERAATLWSRFDDATAHYNRANALALHGALTEALDAYDLALSLEPELHDAVFNRALVKEALARQRQQRSRGNDRQRETPRQSVSGSSTGPNENDTTQSNTSADTESTPPDDRPTPEESAPETEDTSGTEDAEANSTTAAGLDGAELRRLEGLLSTIPDEPGTLLKNRFSLEYKLRSNKHTDTGARW